MKRARGGKDKGGGKRSKGHYFQGKGGGGGGFEKRQFEAKDGFKGVLVTCEGKNKEARTVHELFGLLNEYADALLPQQEKAPQADEALSVEDGLAQEIASLKKEVDQGQRRFYVLETNVKGVIFIRFTDSRMQPVPFVTHILDDLRQQKQQKTKNAVRVLPIEKTCAVQPDKVLELINELARPHFPPGQKTPFTVVFKRRNNDKVRQMPTIEGATKLLSDVGILNYRHPEITILVEIFQRACGIGVIPNHNYQRLKEFNLRRIYEAELGTDQVTEKSGAEISTPPNQPEPKDQLEKSDVEEKEPAATSQQESST